MVVSRRLRERDALDAGIEKRETAGAVGRLHHAGLETALPNRGGLLIAGDAENTDRPAEQVRALFRRTCRRNRAHPASRRRGTPNRRHRSSIPLRPADIEQQRARRVGGIGQVHLAARETPQQKAVDSAESELAGLGRRARAFT